MGGWMGDHAHVCFIMKIILNLIMKWVVVVMSHTLDLLLFQLVSLNFFNWYQSWHTFVYSYMFYICMLTLHIVSISIGIYFLHTYIDDLFVLQDITNFGYVKLELFQLVSIYKLYHNFKIAKLEFLINIMFQLI